jgi:imidazolonepropionase-like amidohydrolase
VKRIRKVLLIALALSIGIVGGWSSAEQAELLVLTNLTLIDGNGGPPKPNTMLVISGERIVDILDAVASPPAGAKAVDLSGRYAIPGLIDSHVHLTGEGRDDEAILDKQLQILLLGGVTSVRDMGGDGATLAELAKDGNDAAVQSPRIYFSTVFAGPTWFSDPRARSTAHGMTPGQIAWQRAVAPETDLQQAVAEAKASGATGLKIYANVAPDLLAKVAAEGRRQGLKVWSHAAIVPSKPTDAVIAGVEVLSHSVLLGFEFAPKLPAAIEEMDLAALHKSVTLTPEGTDKLLTLMRDKGVILDATLFIFNSQARSRPPGHPQQEPRIAWTFGLTRRAHELGVRIAAGTDDAVDLTRKLPNLHQELELLVTYCGLSPLEAITAATRTGAQALGDEAFYGTIAVGKAADLVILKADPTKDIRNTTSIVYVVKGGRLHQREQSPVISQADAQNYVGQYDFPTGFRLTVSLESGRLYAEPKGQPRVELSLLSETTFVGNAPGSPRIAFVKDGQGRVNELILKIGAGEMRGKKTQ